MHSLRTEGNHCWCVVGHVTCHNKATVQVKVKLVCNTGVHSYALFIVTVLVGKTNFLYSFEMMIEVVNR